MFDVSKFEYHKNGDNELIAAIYPISEHQDAHEHLGGSINNLEKAGSSRFHGLGVPIGLYLSKKQMKEIHNMKKNPEIHKDCNVIDEDKFNQLLDKIVRKAKKRLTVNNHRSHSKKSGKTKKIRR